MEPVAYVVNSRKEAIDDNWSEIISVSTLQEHIPLKLLMALNNSLILK
jgi:hypothetical protein